jgi:hypothetical protein
MNILCLLGHNWRYNFKHHPNKRICKRCNKKQRMKFDCLKPIWKNTVSEQDDKLFNVGRTNDELINKWIR